MFKNVYEELEVRGLVNQITSQEIIEHLNTKRKVYCGFDPTGDSLHIGHLLPIVILKHFEVYGHENIALVGGATGLIGDPSGKKEERTLNDEETVRKYGENIKNQLLKYLNHKSTQFMNNYEWFGKISAVDFLRTYGKNFGINYLINKESVASRLEVGLSFTEFSYTIIQAIDFLELYSKQGCTIQIGGSDQWGNITSGLELIRKETSNKNGSAYGITVPLVTKSDGTKFGKTEGGSIWLDASKTSVYDFYQFFLNVADDDVIRYLKMLTFVKLDKIYDLEKETKEKPFLRSAQKCLADEITKFVHGEENLQIAKKITSALFTGNLKELSKKEIEENFKNINITMINNNDNIMTAIIKANIATSKREAKELIMNKSIKINGVLIEDVNYVISREVAIEKTYLLIKRGKKKFAVIRINNDK